MIYEGIAGLLASRKGTLCLLILICATVGLLLNKLDGTGYAAVVSVMATIYNFVLHKLDLANIASQNNLPERGQ